MRIYVTKADIKAGNPCNSAKCPVARSLQRRFPTRFVSVGPNGGMIGYSSYILWSPAVRRFIQRFDYSNRKVKPFSFTLMFP